MAGVHINYRFFIKSSHISEDCRSFDSSALILNCTQKQLPPNFNLNTRTKQDSHIIFYFSAILTVPRGGTLPTSENLINIRKLYIAHLFQVEEYVEILNLFLGCFWGEFKLNVNYIFLFQIKLQDFILNCFLLTFLNGRDFKPIFRTIIQTHSMTIPMKN